MALADAELTPEEADMALAEAEQAVMDDGAPLDADPNGADVTEAFDNIPFPKEYTNYPRAIAHYLVRRWDPHQANQIFHRRFGRTISPADLSGPLTMEEKRNFNKMRSHSTRDVVGVPVWD